MLSFLTFALQFELFVKSVRMEKYDKNTTNRARYCNEGT